VLANNPKSHDFGYADGSGYENPMSLILTIPEVAALDARGGLIRIPPELDVPLTPRVRRLIDTPQFRRLAKVSQLGLVSLVYPAAIHTRFEHALGVYRLGVLFLKRLAHDERFAAAISVHDAELFIAAALLHDIGHWPFCHAIEDMRLPGVSLHEELAGQRLEEPEIAQALRQDWQIEPAELAALLRGEAQRRGQQILISMLSGPIDIDKMDYLFRDSLHAGVPYGRNFDQGRLIGSLCLNAAGDGLALTDKGKTAAEMMVFARYVMFSEVYWHHSVRAATAMLQRLFYSLLEQLKAGDFATDDDQRFIARLESCAALAKNPEAEPELVQGLFGPTRRLYKRVAQYSLFERRELYQRLARRPYPWLARCSEQFAAVASEGLGETVGPRQVLFDAPPVEREVEFDVDVHFVKENCYRTLGDVSPVVRTLAREQFDDYVKRVRVFAPASIAPRLRALPNLHDLVATAIERTP
jgi:HD superfamily phosphohydrolase